ncbi:E3 ubiquitin/ISG15 ligase TRIM25-like [Aquarana catesbeiana]|uniref:E3 ubiquitin/ISG15 ligase TRIM25-like n=1 Tax=Aquarana catesbeiana TaxID=8400 RepID=UPI003CC97FC2
MASADVRKELLDCSVCLNIYTDPVTLRCGHNFCRVCIDRVLDTQVGSGVYSCPECRAESVERPVLIRNITLCNIVESFIFPQPTQDETGVFCTYCVDSPVPAVKSCLHCEASLCDKHLIVHTNAPEHVMTEPTTSLGNRKCSIHRELLKYYCIEDSLCVCVSCSLAGEHRGHQVEILDKASEKKRRRLRNVLQELITKREETKRRAQSLQECRKRVQENAAGEAERFSALLTDLRRKLEDLERKVLSEMSREEEKLSLSISDMIQQLEIKKDQLSRKIHHIEEMCNMTDPLTVLQESDIEEEEADNEDRERYDKQIHNGGHLDVGLILQTLHTLSQIVGGMKIEVYVPKPADIILDINTAHNKLHISDDRKTAFWSETNRNRPKTPERFQSYNNVLSSRGFTSGRYYWDTDCSKIAWWRIGMCYPSIEREGDQSSIGENNKSWALRWEKNTLAVIHDGKEIQLPPKDFSKQVRISLDYEAGQLSFYELSQPIRLLHTFTATFTEPLHAVLCVYWRKVNNVYVDSWVRILNSQKNQM